MDTRGGDDGQAYIGRRMLKIAGKGKRGTPKRRFTDVVGADMQVVGVTEKDTEDRKRWKQMIRCGEGARSSEDCRGIHVLCGSIFNFKEIITIIILVNQK